VIKLKEEKYWNETGCRVYRRQFDSDIKRECIVGETYE